MTRWAFGNFGATGLPCQMLVHDLDNPASAWLRLRELSPANPPRWFTDGHHVVEATAR